MKYIHSSSSLNHLSAAIKTARHNEKPLTSVLNVMISQQRRQKSPRKQASFKEFVVTVLEYSCMANTAMKRRHGNIDINAI